MRRRPFLYTKSGLIDHDMKQTYNSREGGESAEIHLAQNDPKKLELIFAKERTILAKQRNFLAHINTGLGSIALGFGIVRFFEDSQRAVLVWVGVVFIATGFGIIVYGVKKVISSNAGLRAIKSHRGHLYKVYFALNNDPDE